MVIRTPLSEAEKQQIVLYKQSGWTLRQIAQRLACALETVRKWWRLSRHGQVVRRRGRPAAGPLSHYAPDLIAAAVALKRTHPHWGPANVRLELQDQYGVGSPQLPSVARLAVLFKRACPEAVQPHGHRLYAAKPPAAVQAAHQRWQADAQEKIRLTNGELATLLNVRDEYSGLLIASQAFLTTTPRGWRKLTLPEMQAVLRQAFGEWGRPQEVQTDHEVVYTGSPSADFPSLFTLWLCGLGIAHVTGRTHRPTDQAEIERTHRTLGDLAWKDEPCGDLASLQRLLDQRRRRYNTQYPSQAAQCQGVPPLVRWPAAISSGRPFQREAEWVLFDMDRIERQVAEGCGSARSVPAAMSPWATSSTRWVAPCRASRSPCATSLRPTALSSSPLRVPG